MSSFDKGDDIHAIEGNHSNSARPSTVHSSTATLCHLNDNSPIPSVPTTIAEAAPKAGHAILVPKPTSKPKEESDIPPPIPAPDIVSVFDPASAGGGGPLRRITTEQKARVEAEARERADRLASRANDINGTSSGEGGGILRRFRSHSIRRKQSPVVFADGVMTLPKRELSPHHERRRSISPSISTKTLSVVAPIENENEKAADLVEDKRDLTSPPSVGIHDEEYQQAGGENTYVYPDGGYGWVVLVSCVTLAGCSMGWGMSFGIFQDYYAKVVFAEENTSLLSLIGCLLAFSMGISSFAAGRMGDRYGFKRVLYISAFISWLALFLASWSTKLWQLLLTQGIMSGAGFGMSMPLFMSLPSQWFYKKRGFASGIAMGGAGFGGGASALIVRQLLNEVGYQRTLLIMSFVNLTASLIAIALIKVRSASPEARGGGEGPWVDMKVLKASEFWSLAGSLLISVTGYAVPFVFLALYVTQELPEVTGTLAALPQVLLGFSVCIGRALVGFVADRLGPLNTYVLVFLLSGGIQYCLWLTAKTFPAVCVFAVAFGLVAPGFMGLIPQITVSMFGPANLASNVGMVLLLTAPGNLISGPLAGAIYDASGQTTFRNVILTGGGLQFAGGVVAMWARYKTSRRIIAKV